ncbi:MAG: methionyl-tRNA formyltransferase [Pyrinomonadaceae bacterium]
MKIVFMGTPLAAVPSLEQILDDGHEVVAVYTQPDRPKGRGNKLSAPPVKEFALENDLEIFQPTKIKTAEAAETFKSHNADLAVVVAYGRILPESFLNAFPYCCVNVHFSLLPKYRGAAPVNWAIVNGETKTGITTMKMDKGLDTGDVLLQFKTEIGDNEDAIELMARLSFEGARLLSETLKNLGNIESQKQDESNASYAPILSKDDGRIFWDSRAETIRNHIRGFQPFPTAYANFQNKKFTIWKAETIDFQFNEESKTGTILKADKDDFIVACGANSALKLLEIQIEGKRRMNVRDFLNGQKFEVGDVFG